MEGLAMRTMDGGRYARRWRCRRVSYYVALCLLFAAIAFYFGPNVIMFGKLVWITADDFAKWVDEDDVRSVRAIKEYQRDHGKLPERMEDLVPAYLPKRTFGDLWGGEFHEYTRYGHLFIYRFTPGDEGWRVAGPFVHDRLPLPPVRIAASTRPMTRPD
jgi:hypothetical protein